MPSSAAAVLAWLHAQGSAMVSNVGDIAANRPEPARLAVAYTLVTIAAVLLAAKLAVRAAIKQVKS